MTYKKAPNEYRPRAELAQYTRLLKSQAYCERTGKTMSEDQQTYLEKADTKAMLRENVERFSQISHLEMTATLPIHSLYDYVQEKTLEELHQLSKNLEELLVNLFGLRFDNSAHFKWDLHGQVFAFSIYKHGEVYDLNLWNETGGTTLHHATVRGKHLPKEVADLFIQKATLYRNGEIACSNCGLILPKKDIAGEYFASSYCPTCWHEKGFKEKEAQEDYN